MKIRLVLVCMTFLFSTSNLLSQNFVKVGAEQTEEYLPLLKNKRVAVLANQSSLIHKTHMVDSLLSLNISVEKIFCPEHGFRGETEAGKQIQNYIDKKTKLPVVSLYGKNKKPQSEDLKNIDIFVFDIQDVGVRFYTYISTLHYVMEACAENDIKLIVFDRPNPNGFYVDGPVLKTKFSSFVGMHTVPVVHGLTIGEYAKMIIGENWLSNNKNCELQVIMCQNYSHETLYELPVNPSPNLPNMESVYLYPSLCFFEGTAMSIGRGTEKPFQILGHPDWQIGDFYFTPKSLQGICENPKFLNQKCRGIELSKKDSERILENPLINIKYLCDAYLIFEEKDKFFNDFFIKLAGTPELQKQITEGKTADEIKKSWKKGLKKFKKIRVKYLLYEDFE
ncbi:MAG: DUF1343 domain-containing protein [Bacteroidetes bacterium]|jgi:uncharacterized protein YbbC (DUF1343 family)|nr:DUF1343 domain-containing protein [Bacteroidota bacterium]MBT6685747.1 DUF1343 domain-containing protein [Bacteroidota bacterium]MBT7142950.1 DUF1343 domain-containing protein [Bacteroidota bacterium]MBT7491860.1 DUF1343 domain-containing protein [Bacteroidota bacterium]